MDRKYEDIIQDNIKILIEHIENNNFKEIIANLDELHSVDIAEILSNFDDSQKEILLKFIPKNRVHEVLEEVDADTFSSLITLFQKEQKSKILEDMADDDIVDLLNDLTEQKRKEIINLLTKDSAEDVKELLIYEEDTAGGIMTKDFVVLRKDLTIEKAIDMLRKEAPDAESIYYVFVIDKDEKLSGVISLRDLIVAKPDSKVEEIMDDKVISVNVYDDQELVAKVVSKYDLLAVPVVDNDNRMIGLVTVDDVIDVLEEEATEDILKFSGSSGTEYYEEDALKNRILISVKARLPWLIITIFGGLITAQIIGHYKYILDINTSIALFMPILGGMGGNVGTQSSTLTVRSIAMGHIYGKEVLKTITHEISVGIVVGIISSIIAGAAAVLLHGNPMLALIVGASMFVNIVTAAAIGTLVPLIFNEIGIDPAVASAPFITTTIDITGITIYYTLATMMISKLA